ncbi:hypothetical protein [Rufibacter hautae]|uniref:Transposase n=1 Tax=Rufibacter hautae TaxID=2595005 RepID=A0A5B6TA92_9BACT|nr:hypothetical protein [Rufibacter hautae]KAA3437118.1 hypothetical protein FOA19_22395 [Rufibacter hautae]
MNKRVFDTSFMQMAVELSFARGSVKEVADELGIDASRLSKRRNRAYSPAPPTAELTEDQ